MFKIKSLSNKIRNKFNLSFIPAVVNKLTTLATFKASRKIKKSNAYRILIDNTVLFHGITHETAWISTGQKKWGNSTIETGYSARIPVHADNDNSDAGRSVKYLPGISHLAKNRVIQLCISSELHDEQLTQPIGRFKGYGYFDLSIFKEVEFERIRDPEYSFVIAPSYLNVPNLTEQRKQRLKSKSDKLFHELVSVLGQKNSQDAWHIVTAERNGCYCFLTMDFKLIKTFRSQSKNRIIHALKTKVMTPEEYGSLFSIHPLSLRLFSYHHANSFIRPDLNWVDSKRQKIKKSQKNT